MREEVSEVSKETSKQVVIPAKAGIQVLKKASAGRPILYPSPSLLSADAGSTGITALVLIQNSLIISLLSVFRESY